MFAHACWKSSTHTRVKLHLSGIVSRNEIYIDLQSLIYTLALLYRKVENTHPK